MTRYVLTFALAVIAFQASCVVATIEGAACDQESTCPSGFFCDQTKSPPTCQVSTDGGMDGGHPSGCATDNDCTSLPATPFCDQTTAQCAQCVNASECSTGQVCTNDMCLPPAPCMMNSDCSGTTPICVADSCAECGTTPDCMNLLQNCSSANTCVFNPGDCGSNADCTSFTSTPVCDTSTNSCVQCVQNSDCPSDICVPDTQQCFPAASDGGSDGGPLTMDAGPSLYCLSCQNDLDCGGVDEDGGITVNGNYCLCTSPTNCNVKYCGTACSSSGECEQSATCEQIGKILPDGGILAFANDCVPTSGICPMTNGDGGPQDSGPIGCTSNSGCASPTPACLRAVGECVQCLTSGDCQPGETCNDVNECVSSTSCSSGANCEFAQKTPVCDETTGTCVGCLLDTDCPPGDACNSGHVCEPVPPAMSCSNGSECTDPAASTCNLTTHTCVECVRSSSCGTGNVCTNNVCVASGGKPDAGHKDAGVSEDAGSSDGGICDFDAGAPGSQTCAEFVNCVQQPNCGTCCLGTCLAATSQTAMPPADALITCVEQQCPNGNSSGCFESAATGPCFSQVETCEGQ